MGGKRNKRNRRNKRGGGSDQGYPYEDTMPEPSFIPIEPDQSDQPTEETPPPIDEYYAPHDNYEVPVAYDDNPAPYDHSAAESEAKTEESGEEIAPSGQLRSAIKEKTKNHSMASRWYESGDLACSSTAIECYEILRSTSRVARRSRSWAKAGAAKRFC